MPRVWRSRGYQPPSTSGAVSAQQPDGVAQFFQALGTRNLQTKTARPPPRTPSRSKDVATGLREGKLTFYGGVRSKVPSFYPVVHRSPRYETSTLSHKSNEHEQHERDGSEQHDGSGLGRTAGDGRSFYMRSKLLQASAPSTPSTLTFKRMSSASSPVEQLSSSAVSAASPARSVSGTSSQPEADEVDRVIEGEEELLQTAALDSDQSVPCSSIENQNQPVEALETSQQTSQQTWLRLSGAKRWADSLEDPDEEQFCGLANWPQKKQEEDKVTGVSFEQTPVWRQETWQTRSSWRSESWQQSDSWQWWGRQGKRPRRKPKKASQTSQQTSGRANWQETWQTRSSWRSDRWQRSESWQRSDSWQWWGTQGKRPRRKPEKVVQQRGEATPFALEDLDLWPALPQRR
ncbi:unnamed protein product [Durusdinium trenchii]|uniref:Uncharacterized protein n=1 Tax=Durusdinium trenchii TaxID=1381693 RepID=A0ABP0P961_9DINO